ncbi:MAG: hypothetical protein KatS3mg076_0779 [Candidatus Binatia bacterium]|nr:MAG: hypothetical protein KatS3mg076_0779 [Candidatus Binatia bacterium]
MESHRRLFLRLGDTVVHLQHSEWGNGVVVEEMTSSVPGGTCLVRVLFDDGRQRTFNNDMDNELCCYYFGMRKFGRLHSPRRVSPARRQIPR